MKKSKFLKKSLAMLLALMLVVAMIPLSASASSINLDSIYVDGNKVKIDGDSLSVGVNTTAETVEVGTNEDLQNWQGNEHELRVADPDSLDEKVIAQQGKGDGSKYDGTEIDLDTYMYDVDAAGNGKITLKLYDLTTGDRNGRLEKTITMNVTRTTEDTTTNLASVKPGVGVYEILNDLDEINETKVRRGSRYQVYQTGRLLRWPLKAWTATIYAVNLVPGNPKTPSTTMTTPSRLSPLLRPM